MKNISLFYLTLCIILSLYLSNGYAQDYMQWQLPEGAKMRLGKGEINDIKFSPDGSLFAVATSFGIWIYDVQSQKELTFLKSKSDQINAIAFTDEGASLVSASEGGNILTWEIDSETISTKPILPKLHRRLSGTGFFWASALSNDGHLLAVGSGIGLIHLWDLRTGNRISTFKAHTKNVSGLGFSPNGVTLASGSTDSKIHLWGVPTQTHQQTLTQSYEAQAIAFTSDGKRIAAGSFSGFIQSWDLESKQKLASFKGHTDAIRAMAFSPDAKILASGSWDATIRLWDTNTGNQIGIITGHPHFVEEMAFAPDGNKAAGTTRGNLQLWDVNTGNQIIPVNEEDSGPKSILAFSEDSSILLGMRGFQLQAFDATTNLKLSTRTLYRSKKGYTSNVFSKNRRVLAIATPDKKIRLWNVATGDELLVIRSGFKEAIIALTFSVDRKILAGAGKEGYIRLWDTTTGDRLFTLHGHTKRIESLAFSPDRKLLASGSWDGTMRLWDIETKTQISQRGNGFMGGIIEVQFSLDGKTVVSSSTSNRIQLWDVENEYQMPTVMLSGHNGWIRNIEFSADGKTFASGSDDGTILVWDWEECSKLRGINRH